MSKYTYIFAAVSSEGFKKLFRADGAVCVDAGDYVLQRGSFYKILAADVVAYDGDTYKLLDTACNIEMAEAVYCRRWVKPDDK